ncbi:MAG: acyclic terpene utilization AtuA family protein, partial [Isosphaeraceae bacterium]
MVVKNQQSIRIGNGAGFWGDNLDAPVELARLGRLDVLTLEYLAELTLAILAHLRSKDPKAGYVTDFPDLLERLVPILRDQAALKIVTNAGGLNPPTLAARCGTLLNQTGQGETPLAVVTGDDLLEKVPQWILEGLELNHMDSGRPISDVADRLVCANAYLGARPIADALNGGARIVLTGRVADASLTLGPACSAFGWSWDDWPRLAGGSVAGHLIECGAQATGGLWHRWDQLDDLAGVGYPIAEIASDGSTVLT